MPPRLCAAASLPSPAISPIVSSRDQSVELLRIVAAFGIVAFHRDVAWREIAYAGLIVFVMLAPCVDLRFRPHPRSLASLARTLLLPWLFWTLVYAVIGLTIHKPPFVADRITVDGLLTSGPQLWFLPFIFVVLVIVTAIKPRVPPVAACLAACAMLLGALAVMGPWRSATLFLGPPLTQWVHAAPAAFAGIALGYADAFPRGRIIVATCFAAAIAVAIASGLPGVSVPYPVGLTVTAAAVWFGGAMLPRWFSVEGISRCMMGVYLTHMLWLTLFNRWLGDRATSIAIAAFVAATASTWLCRRAVPLSRLVL